MELTSAGHAALEAELKALGAQRPAIAEELRLAMSDKDFRENAPLDVAREKQAHLEGRIREIEVTLKNAVIHENRRRETASWVRLGSTVLLRNVSSGATVRYTIVGPNEADAQKGKISDASPVGRAILERRQGDEVEVEAPAGVMRFRIEQVEG
ncbi:MAG: GreA/GreB family elongation factor [Dehalococcoidia bacterium]